MNRYEVEFSPRALSSLREATHYILQDSGTGRASDWLTRIMRSTDTLKTHPRAFRIVGAYEGEDVHARVVMRHVLYYLVDDDVRVVTVIDVVHAAHGTARDRFEPPGVRERESGKRQMVSV
ncbi:type II toxin-antitoxin system RelE/ParE family toxin [Candidatus Palauibacter sp.]|uniref:type II toxin-antitoxin system RelE/ParE family toxin n=1 Tax=Candidatus Palauibacter sp. TaxID=3101350 RepID=UPI003B526C9F